MRISLSLFVLLGVLGSCTEADDSAPTDTWEMSTKNAEEQPEGQAESSQPLVEDIRKMVYTGSVQISTKNMIKLRDDLDQIIAKHNGFIAKQDITSSDYSEDLALTVKVPADAFHKVLDDLGRRTEVIEKRYESKDVTAEFIDLNARLKTTSALEARLLTVLRERQGSLEDVLAVEKELRDTRTEIESITGRLKALNNRVTYSTLEISATQYKEILAGPPELLGSRIGRAWNDSVGGMIAFTKGLVVLLVSSIPWIPYLGAFVAMGWWWRIRRRRMLKTAS